MNWKKSRGSYKAEKRLHFIHTLPELHNVLNKDVLTNQITVRTLMYLGIQWKKVFRTDTCMNMWLAIRPISKRATHEREVEAICPLWHSTRPAIQVCGQATARHEDERATFGVQIQIMNSWGLRRLRTSRNKTRTSVCRIIIISTVEIQGSFLVTLLPRHWPMCLVFWQHFHKSHGMQ